MSFTPEIEDEVNGYFQRIYNHPPHPTLSIDEVLDMMQRFRYTNNNQREQKVYHCMIKRIIDRYQDLPQYPNKELQITAQLFGGIIERNIVPLNRIDLFLRYVLCALRQPQGSKLYWFGITVLDRFKTRLNQYRQFCELVRFIPHFRNFPLHLIQYVEIGYQFPKTTDSLFNAQLLLTVNISTVIYNFVRSLEHQMQNRKQTFDKQFARTSMVMLAVLFLILFKTCFVTYKMISLLCHNKQNRKQTNF